MTADHDRLELNGTYAMLCGGLDAWNRMHGRGTHALAAATVGRVYDMEYLLSGPGRPWRRAEDDRRRAWEGIRALGLGHLNMDVAVLLLAGLLDGDRDAYTRETGRTPLPGTDAYGTVDEREAVAERYRDALRRVIPASQWDRILDRRVMERDVGDLSRLAAHLVRVEREGGRPDLDGLIALCHDGPADTGGRGRWTR